LWQQWKNSLDRENQHTNVAETIEFSNKRKVELGQEPYSFYILFFYSPLYYLLPGEYKYHKNFWPHANPFYMFPYKQLLSVLQFKFFRHTELIHYCTLILSFDLPSTKYNLSTTFEYCFPHILLELLQHHLSSNWICRKNWTTICLVWPCCKQWWQYFLTNRINTTHLITTLVNCHTTLQQQKKTTLQPPVTPWCTLTWKRNRKIWFCDGSSKGFCDGLAVNISKIFSNRILLRTGFGNQW